MRNNLATPRVPYDSEGNFTGESFCDICHQSAMVENIHTGEIAEVLYFDTTPDAKIFCVFESGARWSKPMFTANWKLVRCHE